MSSTVTQIFTGAYSIFSDTAAPATTAEGIKNSLTSVYWVSADNTQNSGAVYLQVFNQPSGNATVGVTPADFIMYIGGSSQETYDFSAALTALPLALLNGPWVFSNGLSIACTTTPNGNSAPSSPVIITIAYN